MSGSMYKIRCPHCGHAIRVRNSIGMHPLFRSMYLQCTNVNCGATYRGQLEITHTMSPSACPNPDIHLPLADYAMRRLAAKQEEDKQMDIDDVLENDELQGVHA